MLVHITPKSSNAKTGKMPVTTTERRAHAQALVHTYSQEVATQNPVQYLGTGKK